MIDARYWRAGSPRRNAALALTMGVAVLLFAQHVRVPNAAAIRADWSLRLTTTPYALGAILLLVCAAALLRHVTPVDRRSLSNRASRGRPRCPRCLQKGSEHPFDERRQRVPWSAVGGHDRDPRSARAQPPQRRPRAAARQADRVHRAVGLGQVVAGVRHHLRRGPAPLRRVAVGVRAAVPRADGQARRRLHRGPVAGDLDRPEVGVAQPALDRRHDHRDLRLPAAAVRADRHAALPELRAGDHPPDAAADRRPRAPARRGHPLPGAGAGRARPQGRVRGPAQGARQQGFTRARVDGELVELGAATSERLARYENHTIEVVVDRLVRRPGIERRLTDSLETALRLAEGVAEVEIVPRDDDPSRSRDAHVLGAPRVHALRRLVRRARAAQLLVQLAVRRVRAVRRSGHALRGRPRAARPRRRPQPPRRRDRAVVGVPEPLLRACARVGRRRVRLLASTRRGRS